MQLHPFLNYMRYAIQVLMFKYRIRDAKIYNNTILYQKLIINLPQCDVYVRFIPVEFTFVINTMESPGTEFFFCCCLTQKGVPRWVWLQSARVTEVRHLHSVLPSPRFSLGFGIL